MDVSITVITLMAVIIVAVGVVTTFKWMATLAMVVFNCWHYHNIHVIVNFIVETILMCKYGTINF